LVCALRRERICHLIAASGTSFLSGKTNGVVTANVMRNGKHKEDPMSTKSVRLSALFLFLLFAGCSVEWKAKVESDTRWSGSFSGRTVDGTGNYSRYYSNPGGWEEHDLFATQDLNKAEYRDAILKSKGQTFSVYLPIQYQGKTLDYTFEFRIADVKPISQARY
jgi:hypothetical protein